MAQNSEVGTALVPVGKEIVTIDAEFKDVVEIGSKELEEMFNYIRPNEAKILIDATDTPRNHLLFNSFWQTGGRVSEILSMRPMDISDAGIHMVTKKKRVMNKRRSFNGTWKKLKEPIEKNIVVRRTIKIQPELRSEIMSYAFNTRMNPDDLFFPITPRRVEQILDDLGEKTGISKYKKLHPHLFRHGFAVNFINQQGSLPNLKKIMGHNHIQTTMIYLRLTDSDIARDIDRMVF